MLDSTCEHFEESVDTELTDSIYAHMNLVQFMLTVPSYLIELIRLAMRQDDAAHTVTF